MFSRANRHRAKSLSTPALAQAVACVSEPLERRVLLSGGHLYVTNLVSGGAVGEYNLDGATVNASLVSGLDYPAGIAFDGSDLFVTTYDGNTIGQYTTTGATVNASLVTGLDFPASVAVSGSDLFVLDAGTSPTNGYMGKYTTSGTTVNATLVPVVESPVDIAVSGSDLFVTNYDFDEISEYTTSGTPVSVPLIAGLSDPWGIAVSGSDLFVVNSGTGTIGQYTTSGAMVNAALVSGLVVPEGIAVLGSDLFVSSYTHNSIGEYTTSGATVNASLISGLSAPDGLVIVPAPVVTTNPATQAVVAGATVTFTAAATSSNTTPTVQWQLSTDGGNTFTNISGATSTTYSFTAAAAQDGDQYEAVFTNLGGPTSTAAATLTVYYAPVVRTNPTSQSVTDTNTATFTVAASADPTPTLQWKLSTDGGRTFTDILGATSTTYSFTVTTGQTGDKYEAVFTNSQGSATTTAATLTVTPPLPASVSGIVYDDKHDYGVKTRKDVALADITLTLQQLKHHKPTGRLYATTTNSKGDYSFAKLTALDTYRITEVAPRGDTITQPSTLTYTIDLSSGQNLTGQNFGDYPSKRRRAVVHFSDQPILSSLSRPTAFASLLDSDMAAADGNLESTWSLA